MGLDSTDESNFATSWCPPLPPELWSPFVTNRKCFLGWICHSGTVKV